VRRRRRTRRRCRWRDSPVTGGHGRTAWLYAGPRRLRRRSLRPLDAAATAVR
jgi:hypothetical protein